MNETKKLPELWNRYVEAVDASDTIRFQLLQARGDELRGILRDALKVPNQRRHALGLLKMTDEDDRKSLFSEVLGLASFQNQVIELAVEVVLSLPRPWLDENFMPAALAVLKAGEPQDYNGLLAVYSEVDAAMALSFARRIAQSGNEEIRAVGEWWVSELQSSKDKCI